MTASEGFRGTTSYANVTNDHATQQKKEFTASDESSQKMLIHMIHCMGQVNTQMRLHRRLLRNPISEE
jgi:hypothetical protein